MQFEKRIFRNSQSNRDDEHRMCVAMNWKLTIEKSSQVITFVVASVVCLFLGEVQGKQQAFDCRFLLNTSSSFG